MLNRLQHPAELVEAHSPSLRYLFLDVAGAAVDGEILSEVDGDPTAAC